MQNGDIIIIKDLEENSYEYSIYKKYEIDEEDTDKVINSELEKELTLCTCTFDKDKRLIIKANFIEK